MDYNEAREKIQDGDLIGLKESKSIVHALTKFFTKSPYTHTGAALWLHDGLWLSEINGGRNHLIPMSQLEYLPFDVYECPVDRTQVRDAIFDSMRVRVRYSMTAFIVAGFCDYFGLNSPKWTHKSQICSTFSARVYHKCGWPLGDILMSPRDLCASLKLKLSVN